MNQNIKDLKKYIKLDGIKIQKNIFQYLKKKRIEEANKLLSNKERPSWNGNSVKVENKNELSLDSNNEVYDKYDLRDQKKSLLIYDEIIKKIKTIKDVSSLNIFNKEYEKFFDELIKLKIDLIRSDLIFAKWNYSTNVVIAASKFKKLTSKN